MAHLRCTNTRCIVTLNMAKKRKRKIRQGDGTIYYDEEGRPYMLHPYGGREPGFFRHSPEDAGLAAAHNWCLNSCGYVVTEVKRGGKRITLLFHRMVQERIHGEYWDRETDHINRDKRDNRSWNLRNVSRSENQQNKGKRRDNASGYIGVRRDRDSWRAQIKLNYKHIHLGNFPEDQKQRAAIAADFGKLHYHGDGPGPLNFEANRPTYRTILARLGYLFNELRPAAAIRALLDAFDEHEAFNREVEVVRWHQHGGVEITFFIPTELKEAS